MATALAQAEPRGGVGVGSLVDETRLQGQAEKRDAMIALVPRSDAVLEELRRLPGEVKSGLRAQRHPERETIVVLTGRTWAADRVIEKLVKDHGTVRWMAGHFVVERPQMRLPGL